MDKLYDSKVVDLNSESENSSVAGAFLKTEIVNPAYFIVAGQRKVGMLIQRARKPDDHENAVFSLTDSSEKYGDVNKQDPWFKVQCNYDFGEAEPSWDARRQPGTA